MAYADDKRIRDLATGVTMPLNWRLPFDYTGLAAAEYRTLQQIVDIVNGNITLPNITSGATNPDPAFGNDGDTYYKYVSGATFGVWFKTNGAWGQLLSINLGPIIFTGTTDASGNITATTGTNELVSVYEGNVLVRPEYNKSTKVLSALNPLTAITAYFR